MVDLNPFAAYAQGQQLGMARRAEERLIEDREREAAERRRMSALLAGGIPTTEAGQRAFVGQVAQRDPATAFSWQKMFAGKSPDLLAKRKQEAPFFVSEFQNVTDQASYDRARSRAQELGIEVDDMPDVYNPSQVGAMLDASRYLAEGPPETERRGLFEGSGLQAQANNIVMDPEADRASPEYRRAYNILAQPRESYDPVTGRATIITPNVSDIPPPISPGATISGQPDREPAEPMGAPASGVKVKQVSPAKLTMAESQDLASFDQAGKDIAAAEELLFPDGEFDRSVAAAAAVAAPGTEGRTVAQALRRSIEVLLRLRTGAAAPKEEVDNYMSYYMPSPLDNPTQAGFKRDALKEFFQKTRGYFGQGRTGIGTPEEPVPSVPEPPTPAPEPPIQVGVAPRISSKDEYDKLPSGARYVAPDGKTRIKK